MKKVSVELIKNKIVESITECYVEPTFTEEALSKIEKFSEVILSKFHESLNLIHENYEYVDEYVEDIIDGFYEYLTCDKLENDENFVEEFTDILETVLIEDEV
jgi:hypothetical protein